MIFTSCQVNCWSELWAQKSCIQSRQPARSQPYPLTHRPKTYLSSSKQGLFVDETAKTCTYIKI